MGKAYSAKGILQMIGQPSHLQKANDLLQKSTNTIDKWETAAPRTEAPEISSKLLETLLKDQFEPSGQPPKKKKRKKLNR
ncbi:MAG: hypothetical protein EOO01_25145 [Chitinophagaceae bacterium]|nr:MAG: hypothetical protein EOO01_25145 [Chitinophagaceae bacterium]